MESSMVSSPNNSGLSSEPVWSSSIDHEEEPEEKEEESGWTDYLVDFSDNVRRKDGRRDEEEIEISYGDDDQYISYPMLRSASMVSDAGSGPEWKLRNYNNINNMCSNNLNYTPKRLIFKEKMAYDDSLEDTASSPVNSPKITNVLKRMDINCRRADETFGNPYVESRHDDDEVMKSTNVEGSTPAVNQQGKLLGEKGLCLVPVTMLISFNNYQEYQRLQRY